MNGNPQDAPDHFQSEVSVADETIAPVWDEFVRAHPAAYGYHQWAWTDIFRRSLKLTVYPLAAWRAGKLVGILPLVRQRLWPLSASLISLPFVNYAGVLAQDESAETMLLSAAVRLAHRSGATRIELRHAESHALSWSRREDKVSFVLDLSPGRESIWRSLPGPRRTQIRRAQKDGLQAEVGGGQLLEEFYRILSRKWRDHGTPVLPRDFYAAIMRRFPEDTRICLVRSHGRPAAASFLYRFGSRVEVPWVGALPEFSTSKPNILLYWTMIEQSYHLGARYFDFGRSSRTSGNYDFKKRWGGDEKSLPWSVWPPTRAGRPDAGLGASLVKSVWKHLPVGLATTLGRHVSPYLPL